MKQQKALWGIVMMLLPVFALNTGCASSASDVASVRAIPLIIKVNQADEESALRARLKVLAAACEVQLNYSRPMSGGAHIVQMRAPEPDAALHCLRAQPEVVYVQEDKLARPMRGGAQ